MSPTMTPEERAIREALANATPGPWIADDNDGYGAWGVWSRMTPTGHSPTPGPKIADVIGDSAEADANAALIAACNPAALTTLLKEMEALRAAATRWRHFTQCGLPITYLGTEYADIKELEAQIDAAASTPASAGKEGN